MSNDFLKNLQSKNIHVVGASGTEGSAVLLFLVKNGIKNIVAHDFSRDTEELRNIFFKTHLWLKGIKKSDAFAEFLKLPVNFKLKDKYLEGVLEADIIFVPSSWCLYEPNFPLLDKAKEKGIEFSSLTKLYFELAKGKIISVTGTKGKGTTSRLIYDILLKSSKKRNVYLAGNDRRSAQELDKVSKMAKEDTLILETSNRQLMIDLGKSPDIGVITNISPDHIDEHGSFEKYIEVKKSLFGHARKDSIVILNYDNEITRKFGEELNKRKINVYFFSRKNKVKKGVFAEDGKIYISVSGIPESKKEYICELGDIKIIGEHNIENVLAAALAAHLAGAKPEQIKKAVQEFRGLPHRIEFIGEFNGVKFYDDLASTNPDSAIAAIKAINDLRFKIYDSRIILVAGGDDKGMDYAGLAKEIAEKVDRLILLPGTGTEKIKLQITNYKLQINSKIKISNKIPFNPSRNKFGTSFLKKGEIGRFIIEECGNFSEALDLVKKQTKTGDIVLISPAAAHFQARYIDVLKKPLRNIIVERFGHLCHSESAGRRMKNPVA